MEHTDSCVATLQLNHFRRSQSPRWIVNTTLTPTNLELSVIISNGTNRVQYKVNLTTTVPEDGSTGQRPLLVRQNATWTDKNTGEGDLI